MASDDEIEIIRDGIEINKDLYPSNATKPKEEPPKKVAHGMAVRKKRTLKQRIHDFFYETGPEAARTYIYEDIVEPAIMDMASDIVHSIVDGVRDSVDAALFGGVRESRYRRGGSEYYRSYDSYYDDRRRRRDRQSDRDRYEERRERYSRRSDEAAAMVESREEAITLIHSMQDRVHQYRKANVAYFYDIADMPISPTDENYGWTLDHPFEAKLTRCRDGWIVEPVRPIWLE